MIRLNKLLKGNASEWLHSILGAVHCPQITLETSTYCSLCCEMSMKMLMGPNADRWSFTTMSVHEEGWEMWVKEYFCLFFILILPVLIHRCEDLLFYYKLYNIKSQRCPSCLHCMFTALLFHPQQVCLQASVNHDVGLLAALLGSC